MAPNVDGKKRAGRTVVLGLRFEDFSLVQNQMSFFLKQIETDGFFSLNFQYIGYNLLIKSFAVAANFDGEKPP